MASIIMFGGNFAPRGWAFCEGQLLPISQYSALFSLLGTTYGGDGRTTFALPDLRGRAPIQQGNGPGLSDRRLGAKGGTEYNILNITQIPSHNHSAAGTLKASTAEATTNDPTGKVLAAGATAINRSTIVGTNMYAEAAPNVEMAANEVTVAVGNTGGNQSVNNMQPWIAINYIIALQGVFPSRS